MRYQWRAFGAIGVSFVTTVMATPMVLLALPSIAGDFSISLRLVSWVVLIEALVVSSSMLPAGHLADVLGRRRVHLLGLALFGLGSIATALSPSFALLIAARAVMGLGAAMLQSVGTAMIVSVFPAAERGRGIGSLSTAVAVGAAIGPILGGILLQVVSWRTLFLMLTVPIVFALVASSRILDDARVGTTRHEPGVDFDWLGAGLSGFVISALIVIVSNPFGLGYGSPLTLSLALASVGASAVFIWWERRTPSPLVDPRLFTNRTFSLSVITRLLGFVATSTRFLLPIYLIAVVDLTEGRAGVILFFVSLGVGTSAQVIGRLTDRSGAPRLVIVGFALMTVTLLMISRLDGATPLAYVSVLVLANGFAHGTWNIPNNSMVLGSAPATDLGVAAGLVNLLRNVGDVIGQALATMLIALTMAARGFDVAFNELSRDPGAKTAFLAGWKLAFTFFAGVSLVALLLSLWNTADPTVRLSSQRPRAI